MGCLSGNIFPFSITRNVKGVGEAGRLEMSRKCLHGRLEIMYHSGLTIQCLALLVDHLSKMLNLIFQFYLPVDFDETVPPD